MVRDNWKKKKGIGLEVPCIYIFSGPHKLVKKLETLLVVS